MIKGLQVEWGACSRTVPFDSCPQALAYWKNLIAVGLGSYSSNIIILNTITGVQVSVLSQHTDWVQSLAFSFDGTLLVSGSDDRTVNLWDVQTGGVIKTFSGHSDFILSVSISLDQTRIASGSGDRTIRLWDIQTGECCCVIEQQSDVSCVRFSPVDPQCLRSVSGDKVWQWNINGHQIGSAYDGSHAAFSKDGTQIVICWGEAVTVQSSGSGSVIAQFHEAGSTFRCCCFSPDGRLVAGAAGRTIYIWDITGSNPHPIETFVGHDDNITSLTFSSSLISASEDRSVKFWQIGAFSTDSVVADATSAPLPIISVALQTKDNIAISSDSAGVVKIWDISTGLCKASIQTPGNGGPLQDAQLVEGRLVLVWRADYKTHIWDSEKDGLQVIDTSMFRANGLRISGDGSKIFTPTEGFLRAWSVQTGEPAGEVEVQGDPLLDTLYVDGSRIWILLKDLPNQGWDFGIPGSSPIPLIPSERPRLDLINETKWPYVGLIRIRDMVSGKVVFQLCGKYAESARVQWDGRYLAAGYKSGEVIILDFNHVIPQ